MRWARRLAASTLHTVALPNTLPPHPNILTITASMQHACRFVRYVARNIPQARDGGRRKVRAVGRENSANDYGSGYQLG